MKRKDGTMKVKVPIEVMLVKRDRTAYVAYGLILLAVGGLIALGAAVIYSRITNASSAQVALTLAIKSPVPAQSVEPKPVPVAAAAFVEAPVASFPASFVLAPKPVELTKPDLPSLQRNGGPLEPPTRRQAHGRSPNRVAELQKLQATINYLAATVKGSDGKSIISPVTTHWYTYAEMGRSVKQIQRHCGLPADGGYGELTAACVAALVANPATEEPTSACWLRSSDRTPASSDTTPTASVAYVRREPAVRATPAAPKLEGTRSARVNSFRMPNIRVEVSALPPLLPSPQNLLIRQWVWDTQPLAQLRALEVRAVLLAEPAEGGEQIIRADYLLASAAQDRFLAFGRKLGLDDALDWGRCGHIRLPNQHIRRVRCPP